MAGREVRMAELKKEIRELRERLARDEAKAGEQRITAGNQEHGA